MERSVNERAHLTAIGERTHRLRAFLADHPVPDADGEVREWFDYLSGIKRIVGNASNDLSLVATLMAKEYLARVLPMQPFDAALKPMGAPGLDIDERTVAGERVVAEIKTTTPHLGADLGATQKTTFAKDFAKLQAAEAEYKFFFVTDPATHVVALRRYAPRMPEIAFVLLGANDDRESVAQEGHPASAVVLPLSRASGEGEGG
jgi:hypothetical protein